MERVKFEVPGLKGKSSLAHAHAAAHRVRAAIHAAQQEQITLDQLGQRLRALEERVTALESQRG
jgi:hypothetical protein